MEHRRIAAAVLRSYRTEGHKPRTLKAKAVQYLLAEAAAFRARQAWVQMADCHKAALAIVGT